MDPLERIYTLEQEVARRGAELEHLQITLEEELAGKHEVVTRIQLREREQQDRIDQLATEVHRLTRELDSIRTSRSWRLISPVRGAVARFRGR